MESKNIKEYFDSKEALEDILQSIPVRKLVNQADKDFIRKMKKYLKEYGDNMTMLESQYKRIILLKEAM